MGANIETRASTKYNKEYADFSDRAHFSAQSKLYPDIFGVDKENIEFEFNTGEVMEHNRKGEALDGDLGIDRVARIDKGGFKEPIRVTIQERFRTPEFLGFNDITITEWNNASDRRSEFYKLTAHLFVYAFWDEKRDKFLDAIAVNTYGLMNRVVRGDINYDRKTNCKDQTFLIFDVDDLEKYNLIEYRM